MNNINDILRLQQESKRKHKLKLGAGFVEYIAKESNNKYDRGVKFTGLSAEDKVKLMQIIDDTEFEKTLVKIGNKLSKDGKGWALVSYMVNGKPFIDYAEIYDFTKVAGWLVDITLSTKTNYIYKDTSYEKMIRFCMDEESKVIKSEGIVTEEGWIEVVEPIVYPGQYIPAWPMENNALGQPDIIKELRDAIKEMDYYGEQIGVEYEKVKTQFINNKLFGSTKSAKDWEEGQQGGHDYVHDVNSPDGKLQGSLTPLISGSAVGQQLMQQIQYIEDKVLKYSMQFRETMSGSQNKHNLEVSMENQQAFEYMLNKIEFRQKQLTKFFKLVGAQLGIATDKLKVSLQVSELEQNKIDMMKATIRKLTAEAIQAEGTGANQVAQSKVAASQGATNE